MLNNPYLVALGIPLILLLCGAIAKKLVRRDQWKRTDFFLGLELALAAIGSAMVYFYDLQKMSMEQAVDAFTISTKIGATATFLAIAFGVLLWMLSIHQDWEQPTTSVKGQIIRLGIISNLLGVLLFAGFVVFIKGV